MSNPKIEIPKKPTLEETVRDGLTGGANDDFRPFGPDYGPVERKPGDLEVPLQTMVVRLPEEPLVINGTPFGFDVDKTRLVGAVNKLRKDNLLPGNYEPGILTVSLGESLPPMVDGTDDKPKPPVHDFENNGLHVVVPAEITKSSLPTDEIRDLVEEAMNRDLETGIGQNASVKFKFGMRKFKYVAAAAISGMTGEGIGIVTSSDHLLAIAARGGVGAVAGATAIGLVGATETTVQHLRGRSGNLPEGRATVRKAYQDAAEVASRDSRKPSKYFEEPIILLVPVEE